MFGDKTLGQGWTTAPCPRGGSGVAAGAAAASAASGAGSVASGLGAAAAGLGLAGTALGLLGSLADQASTTETESVETQSAEPEPDDPTPVIQQSPPARSGKKARNASGASSDPKAQQAQTGAAPAQGGRSGARGTGRGDSFCGPGRKLGSENDGPGLSWKCIPDNSRTAGGRSGATGGNGAQQPQRGPIPALVQEVTALLEPTDNVGLVDPDQNGHGVRSRDFNRLAFAALEDGDFSGAEQAFRQAADEAELAGNQREAEINRRNAELVSIDRMLASAARAKGGKDSLRRSLSLKLAAGTARDAGFDDIARKIDGLNARKATAAK